MGGAKKNRWMDFHEIWYVHFQHKMVTDLILPVLCFMTLKLPAADAKLHANMLN